MILVHPLRKQLFQLLKAKFTSPFPIKHDLEIIYHTLSEGGFDDTFEGINEVLEGGVCDEGSEELLDCCFVGGDVHQVEHGLEASHVTALTATAEGKQGLVVAEEFMPRESADLIGLVATVAVGRGMLVQRDQFLLLLPVESAGAVREGGEAVALCLEGWTRKAHLQVCGSFSYVFLVL